MALQQSCTRAVFGKDLTFENAYIQIFYISGDKEKLDMSVNVFADNSKVNIIDTKQYTFVPSTDDDSTNFIKQGYDYLKTLLEYESAIDVLEDGQLI